MLKEMIIYGPIETLATTLRLMGISDADTSTILGGVQELRCQVKEVRGQFALYSQIDPVDVFPRFSFYKH